MISLSPFPSPTILSLHLFRPSSSYSLSLFISSIPLSSSYSLSLYSFPPLSPLIPSLLLLFPLTPSLPSYFSPSSLPSLPLLFLSLIPSFPPSLISLPHPFLPSLSYFSPSSLPSLPLLFLSLIPSFPPSLISLPHPFLPSLSYFSPSSLPSLPLLFLSLIPSFPPSLISLPHPFLPSLSYFSPSSLPSLPLLFLSLIPSFPPSLISLSSFLPSLPLLFLSLIPSFPPSLISLPHPFLPSLSYFSLFIPSFPPSLISLPHPFLPSLSYFSPSSLPSLPLLFLSLIPSFPPSLISLPHPFLPSLSYFSLFIPSFPPSLISLPHPFLPSPSFSPSPLPYLPHPLNPSVVPSHSQLIRTPPHKTEASSSSSEVLQSRRDLFGYMLTLMRGQFQEHAGLLPAVDVASMEHLAWCYDALMYLLQHARPPVPAPPPSGANPADITQQSSNSTHLRFFRRSDSIVCLGTVPLSPFDPVIEALPLAEKPHLLDGTQDKEMLFGYQMSTLLQDWPKCPLPPSPIRKLFAMYPGGPGKVWPCQTMSASPPVASLSISLTCDEVCGWDNHKLTASILFGRWGGCIEVFSQAFIDTVGEWLHQAVCVRGRNC